MILNPEDLDPQEPGAPDHRDRQDLPQEERRLRTVPEPGPGPRWREAGKDPDRDLDPGRGETAGPTPAKTEREPGEVRDLRARLLKDPQGEE